MSTTAVRIDPKDGATFCDVARRIDSSLGISPAFEGAPSLKECATRLWGMLEISPIERLGAIGALGALSTDAEWKAIVEVLSAVSFVAEGLEDDLRSVAGLRRDPQWIASVIVDIGRHRVVAGGAS